MTPFTAAGATQALEDAGALLVLFKDIKSEIGREGEGEEGKGEERKGEVERRLRLYDRVRNARGTRIQTGMALPFKGGRRNPLTDENVSRSCSFCDRDGREIGMREELILKM